MADRPKLSREQQCAYDDARAINNAIMFDADGNVIFDGYAEATGRPGFKTRAQYEAAQAKLDRALAEYRARRERS